MISDWGEVVTRYPYGNVRMDHLLSKEIKISFSVLLVMFYITNNGHWKLYNRSNTILTLSYNEELAVKTN